MKTSRAIRILLLALLWATGGYADDEQATLHPKFSDAIKSLSTDIIRYVTSEPETDNGIRVGSWDGPGGGGSLISITLRETLTAANITLKKVSGYSVSGNYEQDQNTTGQHVTVLTASIKNTSGNEVHVLRRRLITDDKLAIKLFGVNVDNTAASDKEELAIAENANKTPNETPLDSTAKSQARLRETIANPKASTLHVAANPAGTPDCVLQFAKDSPYGIELLICNPDGTFKSCPIAVEDGAPFTDINDKQVYAIKVYNRSNNPVGVDIAIDGVNIFAFSDNPAWKQLGKVFVRPGAGLVRGWSGRGAAVNEFTIVEYGESAAAELGLFKGVGSITAVFHPAFESKGATGRGKEVDHGFEPVHAKFSQNILGSVSVKYIRENPPEDLPPGE